MGRISDTGAPARHAAYPASQSTRGVGRVVYCCAAAAHHPTNTTTPPRRTGGENVWQHSGRRAGNAVGILGVGGSEHSDVASARRLMAGPSVLLPQNVLPAAVQGAALARQLSPIFCPLLVNAIVAVGETAPPGELW